MHAWKIMVNSVVLYVSQNHNTYTARCSHYEQSMGGGFAERNWGVFRCKPSHPTLVTPKKTRNSCNERQNWFPQVMWFYFIILYFCQGLTGDFAQVNGHGCNSTAYTGGKGAERLLGPSMIIYFTLSKDTEIPNQLSESSFGCMTMVPPCNEGGEGNN